MKLNGLGWAFVERILPRAASAVVMLSFAAVVDPEIAGLYSTLVLMTMFLQSITDGPIKQLAVQYLGLDGGPRFLRQYSIWSSVLGVVAVLGVIGWLYLSQPERLHGQVLSLLPAVLSPVFLSWQARPLALLQFHGEWKNLSRLQTFAVAASLAVSLPMLLLTQSTLGPALQLVLSDGLFWASIFFASRRFAPEKSDDRHLEVPMLRDFAMVSNFSLLGWVQNQADRVLIVFFAGPAVIAQYTLGWALARSASDAVAGAALNVLRPRLAKSRSQDDADLAPQLNDVVLPSIAATLAIAIGTTLVSWLVLPHLLGPSWSQSLKAAAVFAVSAIVYLPSSAILTALLATGRARRAVWSRVVGFAFIVPIGLVAVNDIVAAAWLVVLRQALTYVLNCALNWKMVARKSFWATIIAFALSGAVSYLAVSNF